MGAFALAITAILLFFFGLMIGYKVGEQEGLRCVTRREYLLANVKVLVVGTLASALIWATGWLLLSGIAIGCMAGAIAGLKMSFGESVGPWKAHDRFWRVNKDQLRRAENGDHAEAVRRARRDGTPMPEVMSVASDGHAKGASAPDAEHGKKE